MAAPNEIWKQVDDTLYFVSNLGRVKKNDKILSLCYNKGGYLVVNINKKTNRVHRLIASSFIESNISVSILDVNHKNGKKDDNRVENLEWCTRSENLKHKYRVLKHEPQRNFGINNGNSLVIINKDSGIFYESISEASKSIGINRTTLNAMLRGQNKNYTNLIYA